MVSLLPEPEVQRAERTSGRRRRREQARPSGDVRNGQERAYR